MNANYQDIIGNISEEISELQDFHEKLSNLDSDLSYIIDYIENSSLLNSPNGIRKLFKSLSMYSVVRPLKTHLYLELIEHFKTKFRELRPKEIQERCLSFFVELKCIELGLFNPNFQKEHDQARIQYFWPETYKFVIPNLSDQVEYTVVIFCASLKKSQLKIS